MIAWFRNSLVEVIGPAEDGKKVKIRSRGAAPGEEQAVRHTAIQVIKPGSLVAKAIETAKSGEQPPDLRALSVELVGAAPGGLTEAGLVTQLCAVGVDEDAARKTVEAVDELEGVTVVEDRLKSAAAKVAHSVLDLAERYSTEPTADSQRLLQDSLSEASEQDAQIGTAVIELRTKVALDLSGVGRAIARRLASAEDTKLLWSVVVSSTDKEAVQEATRRLRAGRKTVEAASTLSDFLEALDTPTAHGGWEQSLRRCSKVIKDRGSEALLARAVEAYRRIGDAQDPDVLAATRGIEAVVASGLLDRDGVAQVMRKVGPGAVPAAGNRTTLRLGTRRELIGGVIRSGTEVPSPLWDGLDVEALVELQDDEDIGPELTGACASVVARAMRSELRDRKRSSLGSMLLLSDDLWSLLDAELVATEFALLVERDEVIGKLTRAVAERSRADGVAELDAKLGEQRKAYEQRLEDMTALLETQRRATEDAGRRADRFEQMAREVSTRLQSAGESLDAGSRLDELDSVRRLAEPIIELVDAPSEIDDSQLVEALERGGLERVGTVGARISSTDVEQSPNVFHYLTDERSSEYEILEAAWVLRTSRGVTPVRYGRVVARQ